MFHTKSICCIALVTLPRIWERQADQPGNKRDRMGAPTLLCLSVFLLTAILDGQVPMHGSESGDMVRLLPTDSSVLDLREPRSDLSCVAKAVKPQLGFDLRFHSGYQVNIPLRELPAEGDVLTMIFRVTPKSQEMQPVYFISFKRQRYRPLTTMPGAMRSWWALSIWGKASIWSIGFCETAPAGSALLTGKSP
jgi:hypothetical protein